MPFTAKQGQYLAFIYYYSKIHGIPPAESDFQRFFRVTPPVVHQMIKTLHAHGFIDREPGKARSIRLRLTRAELPDLDFGRARFLLNGGNSVKAGVIAGALRRVGRPEVADEIFKRDEDRRIQRPRGRSVRRAHRWAR